MASGISSEEARHLLKEHGHNELPTAKPKKLLEIAKDVIKEPMFILLIACSTLYLILGDYNEGLMLLSWVLVIVYITFYQHRKTEKSLDALRQMASPRALVLRDGVETRISGREVVPGDVMILNEGDRVPADARIIQSHLLMVDESLLTGESMPVLKTPVVHESDENDLFSGTLVVQGTGMALVTLTGIHTRFGEIGKSLQTIEKRDSPLQTEIARLIRNLLIGAAAISTLVVIAFYITRGNLIQAFLNGLASAMALLPEEFPVVLTVFLALGAWRLSKNNVLTRIPKSIETLGSATVLCSDKTGTITQNRMDIAVLYSSEADIETATGHSSSAFKDLLYSLQMASQENPVDPMEKAIEKEFKKYHAEPVDVSFEKEYPLSKELFALTRVYTNNDNNTRTAFCKGAPEAVFALCRMSADQTDKYTGKVREFASKGYRILAAAECEVAAGNLPEHQTDFTFTFKGLVGFEDPIRPEVPDAIKECKAAGIKVIMITGDYPETAISIAKQIGLTNTEDVITGSDLKKMSPELLREKIATTQIFARIIPEQKLQIIELLKNRGEVVAMTGDGVNDAPALKAADIGVSMGLRGTDVAREASSLVLLDDNFASIVGAIRSGRRIFDNLKKAMDYIMAIHVSIIGLVLLPAFFSDLPTLLMPMHIVFLELIIDPVCSIAFESEQEEIGIMNRPPRKVGDSFFGWNKIIFSLFKGFILLASIVILYFITMKEGHSDNELRAIAFSGLVAGNIFLILTSLSETRFFFSVFREKNITVFIIIILASGILYATIHVPFLQKIFAFENPGSRHFANSLLAAVSILIIFESVKLFRKIRPSEL